MSLASSSLTILAPECDLDSSTPRRHETAIGHIKSCRQFGNLTRFMKVINSLQINWNFLPELYLENRKRLANGPYLIPQSPISQSPVTQSLRFVALGKQSRLVRSKHLGLCPITSSYLLFIYCGRIYTSLIRLEISTTPVQVNTSFTERSKIQESNTVYTATTQCFLGQRTTGHVCYTNITVHTRANSKLNAENTKAQYLSTLNAKLCFKWSAENIRASCDNLLSNASANISPSRKQKQIQMSQS